MGEKIEQVLSSIIILIFDIKKNSCTSYCPLKKIMHNLKLRKKFMRQKIAQSLLKEIMVRP
jgi:hypothetical protein